MNRIGGRVVGYHGTTATCARNILRDGFEPSTHAWDWLGKGIYFFEENRDRAVAWTPLSERKPRRGPKAHRVVLGALIDLNGAMDLTEPYTASVLTLTAKGLEAVFAKDGRPLPKNDTAGRRYFDKILIDSHCFIREKEGSPVPVVRGVFEEGELVHPHSSIRALSHVQLAVRDPAAILGVWRERW